ncbi:MAG: anti-sigma factor [Pirellulaceae bacterium]|nr:anti-sigma factor [Pirellulaceae bacterium]
MNEHPSDNLDGLLKTWSGENEPTSEHVARLCAEVDESLGAAGLHSTAASPPRPRTDPSRSPTPSSSSKQKWLAIAIAALVLIVAGVAAWLSPRNAPAPRLPEQSQYAAAPSADEPESVDPIDIISDQQRQQKQNLLSELDRMFDGKRIWFAETESEVVLGGETKPTAQDIADRRSVAMRLVLAKRPATGHVWQRVWSADVVSRTDQVVQFASQEPMQANANFTAWAHLLPDGLIACDIDLKWNDGKSGELSDSMLLVPGDTHKGASLLVDGVEYRLFHAVSLLDDVKT